ncbi:hypothetical protein BOTBODRAFT_139021 [Botryobasidium botryosum FD-172 SS1]|uniref:SCP domain-containing protein n=1 Tax=Botryobasidium botryosum (strain FD-172 SS1) TaxID=930990 RepID=A0A067LYJ2_BOTB1|nr:hypothetical protein BOTBODRAFT_139021 [Botryobasidium botryosum FD-172 SS1]
MMTRSLALLFVSAALFASTPTMAKYRGASSSPNHADAIHPLNHHHAASKLRVVAPAPTPDEYLVPHNTYRAAHGAAPLTWSPTLTASAQAWADGCKFTYSGPGENIAAGSGEAFGPANAVKMWADEAAKYSPGVQRPSLFTQLVWKDTTEVGCAVASCDGIFDIKYGKASFHVCHYNPPGNVVGQFSENVQP